MNQNISTRIDELYPDLRRYAHQLCDTPDQAEDLIQQAILRVLNRSGIDDLQKYMFSILRNLHRDLLRKKQRESSEPIKDNLTDPGAPASTRVAFRQVLAQITTLPSPYREVLFLLYLGQSYAQIAARLDLPIGTIMSRISRARRALRLSLGLGPDEGVAALLA